MNFGNRHGGYTFQVWVLMTMAVRESGLKKKGGEGERHPIALTAPMPKGIKTKAGWPREDL